MTTQKSNIPQGFIPLQKYNGEIVYAACMDNGPFHGWLMWFTPSGNWVSKRKLASWEVMQAEDQDHYGIIHETSGPPLRPRLVDGNGSEGP